MNLIIMELRQRRRAFVNGVSVSAIRHQSHNSYINYLK